MVNGNLYLGSNANSGVDDDKFVGEIVHLVNTTLMHGNYDLPKDDEIRHMVLDPSIWLNIYKIGQPFRETNSHTINSNFAKNEAGSKAVQLYLLGDAILDDSVTNSTDVHNAVYHNSNDYSHYFKLYYNYTGDSTVNEPEGKSLNTNLLIAGSTTPMYKGVQYTATTTTSLLFEQLNGSNNSPYFPFYYNKNSNPAKSLNKHRTSSGFPWATNIIFKYDGSSTLFSKLVGLLLYNLSCSRRSK